MEDIPMIKKRDTWFRPNGKSMSRLDRILENREWLSKWLESPQHVLERSIFNHCSLVLKHDMVDYGIKQFRVLECWFEDKKFDKYVEEA